jgi:hypothetical protein
VANQDDLAGLNLFGNKPAKGRKASSNPAERPVDKLGNQK